MELKKLLLEKNPNLCLEILILCAVCIQYDQRLSGLYMVRMTIWLNAGRGLALTQGGSIHSPPQRVL